MTEHLREHVEAAAIEASRPGRFYLVYRSDGFVSVDERWDDTGDPETVEALLTMTTAEARDLAFTILEAGLGD
ncbi:hypothetical protein [Mycobacteroides abscessus]|uniref:hypothetical protein n=1 Tax=Mycobacteroides abscessus TaxID=36809 RepID=UPI000C26B0F8|nr:hypothetical protein [Mycobacteroides abscessus]